MLRFMSWNGFLRLFFLIAIGLGGTVQAAEPSAPKPSEYAPADDLVRQADRYLKDLNDAVACESEFKDSESKVANTSNALVVIALTLGLHDQPNKYQSSAAAVMQAARAVAEAREFAAAQKAVARLNAAAEGKVQVAGELRWEKVASLPELMKQVPLIHTRLKANLKGNKFCKKAAETAGYTAVLAAIAQGTMADTSAAKNAEQEKQWRQFSINARQCAAAVNAAIHRADPKAADEAMKKLNQSCEDCHAVFHPTLN
ncbi:MAG: hypothetical protein ABFC54_07925 [Thermoguttaceae bacterium]